MTKMPRITIQPIHTDGELRRWTLSERVTSENLGDEYYTAQLLERLTWATSDAETLEAQTPATLPDARGHDRSVPIRHTPRPEAPNTPSLLLR
jgi:hypothetical protein